MACLLAISLFYYFLSVKLPNPLYTRNAFINSHIYCLVNQTVSETHNIVCFNENEVVLSHL